MSFFRIPKVTVIKNPKNKDYQQTVIPFGAVIFSKKSQLYMQVLGASTFNGGIDILYIFKILNPGKEGATSITETELIDDSSIFICNAESIYADCVMRGQTDDPKPMKVRLFKSHLSPIHPVIYGHMRSSGALTNLVEIGTEFLDKDYASVVVTDVDWETNKLTVLLERKGWMRILGKYKTMEFDTDVILKNVPIKSPT